MAFPTNPSPGDSYTDEYGTVWVYAGTVNGWYRQEVSTPNDTSYTAAISGPAGSNTQVQFNDNGELAGDSGLTYNKTTDALSGGAFIPTGSTVPTNGLYRPSANNVAISTSGTQRINIEADGDFILGTSTNYAFVRPWEATTGNLIIGTDQSATGTGGSATIFRNRGSERLRITSDGKVGLGTSSPGQKLHVAGLGAIAVAVQTNSANNNAALHFLNSSGALKTAFTCDTDTGAEKFYLSHNGADALVIDSSQRVGVGTTTPQAPLSISNGGANGIEIYSDYAGTGQSGIVSYNRSTSQRTDLYISTDETIFVTGGSERARITSDGKLGIGTSSPSQSLQVVGAIASTGQAPALTSSSTFFDYLTAINTARFAAVGNTTGTPAPIYFSQYSSNGSVGRDAVAIDSSGRVGVGTTSPATPLHVETASVETEIRLTTTSGVVRMRGFNDDFIVNADQHRFNSEDNSTEYARIDSSGRLLLGTSSTSEAARAILQGNSFSSTGGCILKLSRGNSTPNDGGDLGNLQFTDSNHGFAANISAKRDGGTWTSGSSQPTRLEFSTTADGASSPTERMRIDSAGRVTVGTISNPSNQTLRVNSGGSAFEVSNTTLATSLTGYHGFQVRGDVGSLNLSVGVGNANAVAFFKADNANGLNGAPVGIISVTTTSTNYGTTSDYRLKENVTAVTDGITRLQQLKPSRFNFIADPDKTVDGFLAHEVQAIVPEAITGEKDAVDDEGNPVYQGIDQSKLVPLLTAALQEAIGEIESLKARVAALESA